MQRWEGSDLQLPGRWCASGPAYETRGSLVNSPLETHWRQAVSIWSTTPMVRVFIKRNCLGSCTSIMCEQNTGLLDIRS